MSQKAFRPEERKKAPPQPHPTSPATLAAAATVRRKKAITLEQIAEVTKIGIRTLRAIEEGDFAKLPGGIYNTSYVRQYARAIDFDEQELLAYYHHVTGTASGEPQKPEDDPDRRPTLPPFSHRAVARY